MSASVISSRIATTSVWLGCPVPTKDKLCDLYAWRRQIVQRNIKKGSLKTA
jgi:hypothetical protein